MISEHVWTCPIASRAHLEELRISGRRAIERSTELLLKSQELLHQPAPDTFAGRAHFVPIPLPDQEG